MLLSLYEQTRQILQIKVSTFGQLPEPQPGVVPDYKALLLKAVEWMRPFVEGYANGAIEDLQAWKQELERRAGALLPCAGGPTPPASTQAAPQETTPTPRTNAHSKIKRPARCQGGRAANKRRQGLAKGLPTQPAAATASNRSEGVANASAAAAAKGLPTQRQQRPAQARAALSASSSSRPTCWRRRSSPRPPWMSGPQNQSLSFG